VTDEILSQDEVESLLSALEPRAEPDSALGRATHRPPEKERVGRYDFRHPERVGKEQMRALQKLHEGFGRNYGAVLSSLLRCVVGVKLTSVDQLTYSEFIFSLENPTCFNVIIADSLEGNLILEINPSILFPMIDRLLGGGASGMSAATRRPLTEIEIRLVSRVTDPFLRELRESWSDILELNARVDRVESNPQVVQVAPPNEVVVIVSFELTIGDNRGMMNLCLPFYCLERFAHKLTDTAWTRNGERDPGAARQLRRQIRRSKIRLVATLARQKVSMAELLELEVGDIIATDSDVHAPLIVEVEGIPKFQADPGAFKGRRAVQIRDVLTGSRPLGGSPDDPTA
jgi:flagellar motor switch protein FliM